MLKRSSKSLLDADDSTAFSSWDMCRVLPGICLGLGVAGLESPSFDAGERPFSSSSSPSFYRYDKRLIRHTKKKRLQTFKRSTKKRLKRFHRPAIPADSEMTLSISRGFASSSGRGGCVGRRPTVGEGAADEKFAFATSASYTAVQPDTIGASALPRPYASLPARPPTPR